MKIFIITVAFCRSAQLARCLLEFKSNQLSVDRHVVVQGHYPIDTERNNYETRLIVESSLDVQLLDPGKDLGSAQSQQWALEQLSPKDDDVWVNLDPDSACRKPAWLDAMYDVLAHDPDCMVISCMSPMVEKFIAEREQVLVEKLVNGVRIGIPQQPTPFNLSMFRCSFVKEMGGLRQLFPSWGELEAVIYHEATQRGKYHAYLLDYRENEDGKYFHPKSNAEWKDRHARTVGPDQFLGSYAEYLAYYHPDIAKMNL